MYTNVARVRRNGGEQAAATLSRTLEDLTRAATPCCRYDVSIVAPPGAEGGQRLLLSVPLPPQVMHVTLPPLATPGKLVEFQLRAPLVDVPDGPLDALALAAGESRGILLERSSSGGLKRKAPTMGNGGMFIGGAADGSGTPPPLAGEQTNLRYRWLTPK